MTRAGSGRIQFDPAALAAELAARHVPDAVELLKEKPATMAVQIVTHLPFKFAVDVLDQWQHASSAALMRAMPDVQVVAFLDAMSPDRAAALLRQLDQPIRLRLLSQLQSATRTTLERLLAYPPDTAGSLMTTEFVSVPDSWTVERTLQHIRDIEPTRETIYAIYILDPTGTLLGAVTLRQLIAARPQTSILSIAASSGPVVTTALTDREDVARLISKYDLLAVPVLDDANRVLGIVTFDDIIDSMVEESTEDVHKLGGMGASNRAYMDTGFAQMVRKRGGWLAVLFMGEMLTATAMQRYEVELAQAVVLALFVPLIISSGGNSGSQATSLLIRALALHEVRLADWWRVVIRELPIGITLGVMLGLIGMARIALWQVAGIYDYGEHWMLIAWTIGVALVGVVCFGSVAGAMLPLLMRAIGFDPATASAPFVATLVDVTGIIIYLSVAVALLKGTLL